MCKGTLKPTLCINVQLLPTGQEEGDAPFCTTMVAAADTWKSAGSCFVLCAWKIGQSTTICRTLSAVWHVVGKARQYCPVTWLPACLCRETEVREMV